MNNMKYFHLENKEYCYFTSSTYLLLALTDLIVASSQKVTLPTDTRVKRQNKE